MSNKQAHRGKHPQDAELFSTRWIPILKDAVQDLTYLLSRGYPEKSSLKLVGDHYQLRDRQRRAVTGAGCSDSDLDRRRKHQVPVTALARECVAIDGYNLLITVETALSGGILLRGRDGCIRDLASIHGSYRRVEETVPAIEWIGSMLAALRVEEAVWYFDAPISNSGRLKTIAKRRAEENGWNWSVELHPNPDKALSISRDVVVSSDSWILNRAQRWTNLGAYLTTHLDPAPEIFDLGGEDR